MGRKKRKRQAAQEREQGFITGYLVQRLDEHTGEDSWNDWTMPLTDWQHGFISGQFARKQETTIRGRNNGTDAVRPKNADFHAIRSEQSSDDPLPMAP